MIKVIPFLFDSDDELYANTYILIDEHKNCLIIDPSKDYDGFVSYIKKNELNLKGILLTHGHVDHIRGVNRIIKEMDVPIYVSYEDEDKLHDTYLNVSILLNENVLINKAGETIKDNDVLHLLDEDIYVIATPYHTSGSICFYLKDSNILFSGDSLFKGGFGRSDLPTGNSKDAYSSIKKILSYPSSCKVYPGHGGITTIEKEKDLLKCL